MQKKYIFYLYNTKDIAFRSLTQSAYQREKNSCIINKIIINDNYYV